MGESHGLRLHSKGHGSCGRLPGRYHGIGAVLLKALSQSEGDVLGGRGGQFPILWRLCGNTQRSQGLGGGSLRDGFASFCPPGSERTSLKLPLLSFVAASSLPPFAPSPSPTPLSSQAASGFYLTFGDRSTRSSSKLPGLLGRGCSHCVSQTPRAMPAQMALSSLLH